MSELFPLDRVVSKIVGVTFEGRQAYMARMKELNITALKLVREHTNPVDKDAIAVHGDYGSGFVPLGFIQNRKRVCDKCAKEHQPSANELCDCGGLITRAGLASELSTWIDQGITYRARVLQYTGGGDDRSIGANILVERVV